MQSIFSRRLLRLTSFIEETANKKVLGVFFVTYSSLLMKIRFFSGEIWAEFTLAFPSFSYLLGGGKR